MFDNFVCKMVAILFQNHDVLRYPLFLCHWWRRFSGRTLNERTEVYIHDRSWQITTNWLFTLRSRQNGCHNANDIFKCIFVTQTLEFQLFFLNMFLIVCLFDKNENWFRRWLCDKSLSELLTAYFPDAHILGLHELTLKHIYAMLISAMLCM